MRRSRKLLVLLGVLVAVCIVTVIVSMHEEKKEAIKNSDEVVLSLDPEKVTALYWHNESGEFSFTKNEKWQYDEDEAFPVDEEIVNEMLSLFEEFGAAFTIEDVEDFGQYGLDEPVCTIMMTSEEAGEIKVTLGDFSKMDSRRYVSVGDGNVYLVKTDPLDTFNAELSDMILDDEIPEFTQVTHAAFSGDVAYSFDYDEEGSSVQSEDVYFVKDGSEALPLDTSLVSDYLDGIRYLLLTDYETYNASEADLKAFGLEDPDLSISLDYTFENENSEEESGSLTLHISRDPEEKAKAEAEEANTEADEEDTEDAGDDSAAITAYARIGDSKIVYTLSGSDYEALMAASYNDLRHQKMYYGSYDDVTDVEILLEETTYEMTSKKNKDERTYYYKDEEIDFSLIRSQLSTIEAYEFTEDAPAGKEEIRLKLKLDLEDYPETEIVFYRHDGDTCLAMVDGKSLAYVRRSDVMSLVEAINGIVLN